MFKLLFGIIIFFVLFLLLTGALGIKILRSLLGFKNRPTQQPRNEDTRTYSNPESKDKIFGDHEGEYVDYEEVDTTESPKRDFKESEKEQS